MSTLLRLNNISFDYGHKAIFDGLSAGIHGNDRIVLLGRNGEGKSTFFKLLLDEIQPDNGEVIRNKGLRVRQMQQSLPSVTDVTVEEFILSDRAEHSQLASQSSVGNFLTKLKLDGNAKMTQLSGGQLRRALLAQSLIAEPDILLLDEPTNHLDIDAIVWLESFLKKYPSTFILITHDRTFMQNIGNRVFELDRGKLITFTGGYDQFITHKATALDAESASQNVFDKKLAQEEAWIRQGVKARRKRNQGRVAALKTMRDEYSQRRERQGVATLTSGQSALPASKIMCECAQLNFSHADKKIIDDFSITIQRGDKIGLIGPNGGGKTTLLKLMLGELKADSGIVKLSPNAEVTYYDQRREQLDLESKLVDVVSPGGEMMTIDGKSKHVISYLQDFLFSAEQAQSKVKTLSGGEMNRLLLAKTLAKPSNILILDEPSNDLDMETLELLEAFLLDYPGTLILVSHDRSLLNNVVTVTVGLNPGQPIQQVVGGYDDYLRLCKSQLAAASGGSKKSIKNSNKNLNNNANKDKGQRVNAHQQRKAIKSVLDKIPRLEDKVAAHHQQMGEVAFYEQTQAEQDKVTAQLAKDEASLEEAYDLWQSLEGEEE